MFRHCYKSILTLPLVMAWVSISLAQTSQSQNLDVFGVAEFSNLQGFLAYGEEVPYTAMGYGATTGMTLQKRLDSADISTHPRLR